MPPQARIPAPSVHPVFIWPTPEREDELFYVEKDGNLPKNKTWEYEDAHPDSTAYPDHKLIHVTPQDGKNWSKWYYAKDRTAAEEEAYNWEYHQADLGGRKFDGIRRTYLIPRASFSATTPAAGAANPDVPAGLFSGYILASREQKRTGDAIFDSLYVIEVRDYIVRVGVSATSYDQSTHGVLVRTETLYYRGETYSGGLIEVQILDETKWGVSAGGVQTEASQLSNDWFLVTSTDVIPQNKTTTGNKFGGTVLRSYDSYITFSWPAVLGDDGSKNASSVLIGNLGFEIMDWVDKEGNARNYVRPLFEQQGYRGPTRATITEEWSLTAPVLSSDGDRPEAMQPKPIVYNSPFLSVNVPPTLHEEVFLICDTSASDPVWGANVGSKRTLPATNYTEWPASLTASVETTPFRGGFITRHVLVYKPEEGPIT